MLGPIDRFLNVITMYRLVLYGLLGGALYAAVLAALGYFEFSTLQLATLLVIIAATCYATNYFLGRLFKAPVNFESQFITALILFFIIAPPINVTEFGIAVLASILAIASKFFIAAHKRHFLNPAAIGLLILVTFGRTEVVWWVGSLVMLPYMAVLGALIIRKLERGALFITFLIVATGTSLLVNLHYGLSATETLSGLFLSGPLVFFGTIMLTEPFTMPPTTRLRIMYAAGVGLLYSLPLSVGAIYMTPELALIAGNIFSYIVSSKQRVILFLKHSKEIASGVYEFTFTPSERLAFAAGQYVEATLPHAHMDSKGMRRYFTVASSPTEEDIKFGIRVDINNPSSFKRSMLALRQGDPLYVASLSGDFTLPKDRAEKLVFIAGGIGVTPFRSMIHHMLDEGEQRNVVLFYANKSQDDIAYQELFNMAAQVGVQTVHVLNNPPGPGWRGESGILTREMIEKYVPDIGQCTVYVSGPRGMVLAFETVLKGMGVAHSRIKTDFFPGYV